MGEMSEDQQKINAIIDIGDEGPNVVALQFLERLKLESIVESDWTGNEPEIKDASSNTFNPKGWLELYFKFENLPEGWHTAYFMVADVKDHDLIIGMPCLLQDNIKSKIIVPLILNNKSQKRETKGGPKSDD